MRHTQKNIVCILLLGVIILLTGCGFHLRGMVNLSPKLKQLYVKTADPYGTLSRDLEQSLHLSGVHLTENPAEATTILVILSETLNQELLSVAGTQLTRQYNLGLTVNFEITDNRGDILLPSQSLSEAQPITIRSDQILAGSTESNNMYDQLRRLIVYDIMNRISSREVTHMLQTKSP